MNRYSYFRNNQLRCIDPTRHTEKKIEIIITDHTTWFDKFWWKVSPKAGLIIEDVDSFDDIATELLEGDKKVKQLNFSGHGRLWGT